MRFKTDVLALVLSGWVSGAAAQNDCGEKINTMQTIGDVRATLHCLDERILNENARTKQEEDKTNKQLLQHITNLKIVLKNVKNIPLKEATNGDWKEVPESSAANACFLSSIRLPVEGLCQVSYQGAEERWAYNISNPKTAGFMCTATCIWIDLQKPPRASPDPTPAPGAAIN